MTAHPTSVTMRGPVLRSRRKLRGLEIKDLALAVGVTPQRISQIETDRKPGVKPRLFVLICSALGAETDDDRTALVA
jgi:transcriptional regulator with XRE-family HTH domain